ncbi:MAG: hypothetical protein HYU66_28305, partial [Armatimonadetes bacterium]|nr:hypothetical protein [Armatimonadota bacterium]
DWLSGLLQPQRLALATCVAAVVVVVSVASQPKDVRLAPSDQAFIEQCLADYHAETAKLGPRAASDVPADPAVDALGSELR